MGKIRTSPLCKSEAFSPSLLTVVHGSGVTMSSLSLPIGVLLSGVFGSGVTASLVIRSGVLGSGLLDREEAGEGAASNGLSVGPILLDDEAGEEADMC